MEKLLVLAYPRSGTRCCAAAWAASGLDAAHEGVARDVVVSSFLVPDDPGKEQRARHGGSRLDLGFTQVWYQHRHPLAVIRSAADQLGDGWWRFQDRYMGVRMRPRPSHWTRRDRILMAAAGWVTWHDAIKQLQPQLTYSAYLISNIWPAMLAMMKVPHDRSFPCGDPCGTRVGHESGGGYGEELGWDDLEDWKIAVRCRAEYLGYWEGSPCW